jgi:2-polyprenyl-6-methoxyphenol hydroxylase-like FAD-dependent oxidoreductase
VELREYIAQLYTGVGWKADIYIQEMMNSDDFYVSEVVQVKVPSFHKGRFVLVGDAGYAAGPTGGGTTLALAGGYYLAEEILKNNGNVARGLHAYEERMRPLVKELQKIPTFVPVVLAPQSAFAIWLRNNIFAMFAWAGIAEVAQRYMGAAIASSEALPVPDYEWKR